MIIDKSKIKTLDIKKPLQLESGQVLDGFTIAYETFGTLNQNKDYFSISCTKWRSICNRN